MGMRWVWAMLWIALMLAGGSSDGVAGRRAPAPSFKTCYHPFWSPDGRRIVFTANVASDDENDDADEMWLVDADGTDLQEIVANGLDKSNPTWSPDGAAIAFYMHRDDQRDLFLYRLRSREVVHLLDWPDSYDGDPFWSPDGRRIYFSSNSTRLSDRTEVDWDIFVMDADGSDVRRVTDFPRGQFSPALSPDGASLVYSWARTDGNIDLVRLDLDGGDATTLTDNPDWDVHGHWSPDGTRILYAARRQGRLGVYHMNADGGDVVPLFVDDESDALNPVWSPDGSRVAYCSNEGGAWDLFLMNADGSERRAILR